MEIHSCVETSVGTFFRLPKREDCGSKKKQKRLVE